jgi:hypothetical protein
MRWKALRWFPNKSILNPLTTVSITHGSSVTASHLSEKVLSLAPISLLSKLWTEGKTDLKIDSYLSRFIDLLAGLLSGDENSFIFQQIVNPRICSIDNCFPAFL